MQIPEGAAGKVVDVVAGQPYNTAGTAVVVLLVFLLALVAWAVATAGGRGERWRR